MTDFSIEEAEWILLDRWYSVIKDSVELIHQTDLGVSGVSVTWLTKDSMGHSERFCASLSDIRAFRRRELTNTPGPGSTVVG